MKFLVLGLVAATLVFGVKCMTIRKDLVSERHAIDADWAQVDAALEHRAAHRTGIDEFGAGRSAHRGRRHRRVNDARNALGLAHTQQEKIQANAQLDEALARLMLQVENYPKLESSKQYGDLLEALQGRRESNRRGPPQVQRSGGALQCAHRNVSEERCGFADAPGQGRRLFPNARNLTSTGS